MRFKWIRVHKLTFAVLLAATCVIGWVRTVTVAQNPSQSQAPRTSIHISTGSSEDPEKAAMALAERDANLAEAQLKSLRDEAAKLAIDCGEFKAASSGGSRCLGHSGRVRALLPA